MQPEAPHIQAPWWAWGVFSGIVLIVLGLDLLIASRESRKLSLKRALMWSAVWVSLAGFFAYGLLLWRQAGAPAASKFAAGYILELSLSVDNLFVFLLIFSQYKVPEKYQRKALFWGIFGALLLRAAFVAMGAALISRFAWLLTLAGAFLVYTGYRLLRHKGEPGEGGGAAVMGLAQRLFRVTPRYEDDRFFVWRKGLLWATPLLMVVLVIEVTDLIFAVDSIPAVFGVTTDPFIVYTSNIFAILGLRSMFFALQGVMHMFRFLNTGLAIILTLIGLKLLLLPMLEAHFGFHVGEYLPLGVIALVLGASVLASLLWPDAPPARRKIRARTGKRS